jgi:hypothetical protein
MSWDGIIFRAPAGVSACDLPSDFQVSSLGTTDEIGLVLRTLFPDCDHRHGQSCIEGDDFWLELNFRSQNDSKMCEHIGVRCNAGLGVIPALQSVCDAFSARLFDNQAGEFADLHADTKSSMMQFAQWRDRVLDMTTKLKDQETAEGQGFEP